MPQTVACSQCGDEKTVPIDPVTGKEFLRTGCHTCERPTRHRAVGRAGPSILATNRGAILSDGSGSGSDADGESDSIPPVQAHIAEIKSSGRERVREMLHLETGRDDPRQPVVAAANTRLMVINGDLTPEEADYPRLDDGSDEALDEDDESATNEQAAKTPVDGDAPSTEEPTSTTTTSGAGPETELGRGECPSCGEDVSMSAVFRESECPACGTPEDELFNFA